MRVITAPERLEIFPGEVTCFLAGGITNCPNWQKEVISWFKDKCKVDIGKLVLLNPRRDNFDVSDPTASEKQIKWEFEALNKADIFSMYFCESEKSNLPICLYELGRHLVLMPQRHPENYLDRIIVSVEEKYSRKADVEIQTNLAIGSDICHVYHEGTENPYKHHAYYILDAYQKLKISDDTISDDESGRLFRDENQVMDNMRENMGLI